MDEVMKTLTIFPTLFMPLSFVAGFFGMNFFYPETPITTWMTRPVFYIILAFMKSFPILMVTWMRHRVWI